MFYNIAVNNLYVLLIYGTAGVLVASLTGSKLAPFASWAVFSIHMVQVSLTFWLDVRWLGLLPCLALVIPHGGVEILGLVMGCSVGSKLSKGQRPYRLMTAAVLMIIIGAYIETYITPFPLEHWLS